MTHDLTPQGPRAGTSPKERSWRFVRARHPTTQGQPAQGRTRGGHPWPPPSPAPHVLRDRSQPPTYAEPVPCPVTCPGLPLAGGPPPLRSETPEAAHPPPSEQDLRSSLSGPGLEASLTARLPSNSSERNQCSSVYPSTFMLQRKHRPLQEALPDHAQTLRGSTLSPRTVLTEAFQNCLLGSLGPSGWLQEGPRAGPHQRLS